MLLFNRSDLKLVDWYRTWRLHPVSQVRHRALEPGLLLLHRRNLLGERLRGQAGQRYNLWRILAAVLASLAQELLANSDLVKSLGA